MNQNKILNIVGYVLLVFWLVFTGIQFHLEYYSSPFWFCNLTVAVMAIACFQKSLTWFYFFLAMGLPFETPWIIDWTIYFSTGYSFFDMTSFYAGIPLYFMVMSFIRHVLTVPLIFVLLFLFEPKKPSKKSYVQWFVVLLVIMVFSYLWGAEENINCSHYFCSGAFANSFYGFWYATCWTIFIFAVSLIVLFFVIMPLHRLIWRWLNKRR